MALAGRGRGAEAVTELGYYQSVFEGLGSWLFGIEYESFRDTDCGGAQRLKKKSSVFGPRLLWEPWGGCCLGTTEISRYRPGPRAKVVPQMITLRGNGQRLGEPLVQLYPSWREVGERVPGRRAVQKPPATLLVSAVPEHLVESPAAAAPGTRRLCRRRQTAPGERMHSLHSS